MYPYAAEEVYNNIPEPKTDELDITELVDLEHARYRIT